MHIDRFRFIRRSGIFVGFPRPLWVTKETGIYIFCLFIVFLSVTHVKGKEHYELSYWTAYQKCHDIGSSLALYEDLEDAQNDG